LVRVHYYCLDISEKNKRTKKGWLRL
jgi:hypothetical protein